MGKIVETKWLHFKEGSHFCFDTYYIHVSGLYFEIYSGGIIIDTVT